MTRPFPEVEGVSHRFVEVGELKVHVAEAGAGEPLVLLHGWPQHWYMWRRQIPVLAGRYRVICPDLRGLGWTDAPPGGYEKENLASDLLGLLDALELGRVRLAGHDWGGWVGFLACLRAPERVERFLALNIPPPWGEPTLRRLSSTWRFWYQYMIASPKLGAWVIRNRPGFIGYLIRGTASVPETWSSEELACFTGVIAEPARARASVLYYRTFLTRELVPILRGRYRSGRLQTPTLLLHGTADFAIATSLVEGDNEPYADDMTVELVPDTGHFIAEERPELVSERALEFFGAGSG